MKTPAKPRPQPYQGTQEFITRVGRRKPGKRYNPFKIIPKGMMK